MSLVSLAAEGWGFAEMKIVLMPPTAMIFVPSVGGISHNVAEYTKPEDLEAGANVLLQTLLELAGA